MTCFANYEGVERLLRDILHEVYQMNHKLSPPPPAPLPPPAAKDDATELPEKFLTVINGQTRVCTRVKSDSWEVLNLSQGVYLPRMSDQMVKALFDEAVLVWIPHKK